MKTSEFNKKIHGDNAKLKKSLKCHGWVMGHGWGQNITLETLHVLVGYVLGARTTRALKCTLGCMLKLDMFWWVVGFKAHVSFCVIFDR
jgi:hypothetical protein